MSEYIKKEDVINAIKSDNDYIGIHYSKFDAITCIQNLEPENVKPVKYGKWIHHKNIDHDTLLYFGYYCSVCGKSILYAYLPYYCSYCGAKMSEYAPDVNPIETVKTKPLPTKEMFK